MFDSISLMLILIGISFTYLSVRTLSGKPFFLYARHLVFVLLVSMMPAYLSRSIWLFDIVSSIDILNILVLVMLIILVAMPVFAALASTRNWVWGLNMSKPVKDKLDTLLQMEHTEPVITQTDRQNTTRSSDSMIFWAYSNSALGQTWFRLPKSMNVAATRRFIQLCNSHMSDMKTNTGRVSGFTFLIFPILVLVSLFVF